MIETRYDDKIAGHVNRDSTAIDAREKAAGKKPEKPKPSGKRGRRPVAEPPAIPEPTRLQRLLIDLPALTPCNHCNTVDGTSFELIRTLDIPSVLAFDEHFTERGYCLCDEAK